MRLVFWYLKYVFLLSIICYIECKEVEIAFRVVETGSGDGEENGSNEDGGRLAVVQVGNATGAVVKEDEAAIQAGILKLAVPSTEHDAQRGKYPWIVGYMTTKLYEKKAGNFEYWSDHCGGTLIALRWILTVAHCFGRSHSAVDYTAFAGGVNFDLRHVAGGEYQQRGVARVIPHENFDLDGVVPDGDVLYQSRSYEYDVAVMQLVAEFDMRGGDVAVARINFGKVEGTTTCKIFGWGEVVTNAVTEDYLDTLDVEPSKIDFPKNLTKTLRYKEVLVKSIDICATEYDLRIPKSIIWRGRH